MSNRAVLPLAVACFASALAALATAEPQSSAATRAELSRWFDRLAASDVPVAAQQQWRYAFSSTKTEPLEALTLELVRAGYAVETLSAAGSSAELRVTRMEIFTPATLERRNRELMSLARKHGARYDSIDVVDGPHTR